MTSTAANIQPPAALAVMARPHLPAQAGRSIMAQMRRIAERLSHFVAPDNTIALLDDMVRDNTGSIVALEAPRGAGVTALIAHLAARRRWAFWLPEDDASEGMLALCAQLIALADLPLPLVPPAAQRDSLALEQLLHEASERSSRDEPLIVLIGRQTDATRTPWPAPLPQTIPPGVTLLLAGPPGMAAPVAGMTFASRITLNANEEWLTKIALGLGCSPELAITLANYAEGSPLYIRLASGLITSRMLEVRQLPMGLAGLYAFWWQSLNEHERRLAAIMAAASEPLAAPLAAELAGIEPTRVQRIFQRWGPLIERRGESMCLYHQTTRQAIIAADGNLVTAAHESCIEQIFALSHNSPERPGWNHESVLSLELARHFALGSISSHRSELLISRAWIRAQERRHGDLRVAATDSVWALRAAAQSGTPLQLVRTAALAGNLALLARRLPPRAAAEAFASAIDQGQPRDFTLRRLRAMIDQLPDGRDKAMELRQLGEVCYSLRMRAPAMRMLSEALDLEAPGPTRQWRDQREEALVALARAAIGIAMPDTALGITTRIIHPERRGMIETEVVRWLIARGKLGRAEEVAYAIGHAGNHEWAMAEVAIGHARAADYERAGLVLDTLRTSTAIAWVTIELACDAARRGNPRAADRVALLPNPTLRDRALAQVAVALIVEVAPAVALEVARMIDDHETRARCLIDMALAHPPTAFQALDEAATAAIAVEGEERASVIAMLAAAEAASGRAAVGMRMAALLPEGEERDRAKSRIAAALARRGDFLGAEAIATNIKDEDERGWALDELARMLAAAGRHREAFALAMQIDDVQERTRLEADLTIAWARAGEPAAAYARAEQIGLAGERSRAQTAIAIPLVLSGARAPAFARVAAFMPPDARSRYLLAATNALASNGLTSDAMELAMLIPRPLEYSRAAAAAARATAATGDMIRAQELLARAFLSVAPLGRVETLQCIALAADTLAMLGGAELLLAAAAALDDIDGWLT